MAKRKTNGVNVSAPIPMPDMQPRMYIDLRDGDVDLVQELKVGDNVRVLIKGKVAGLNARTSEHMGEGKSKNGDIQLEKFDVELVSEGEYAALSRDD